MRIAIGLAVAGLAWGQLPRPIAGLVVNGLTGEPLRRVSVQVMSAPRPVEPVVTDALGRFRLPELPPGRYRLRATRAGFFPSEKGDAAVEVTPGLVMGATSTAVGAALVQALVLEAASRALERGWTPEVYLSSNGAGEAENARHLAKHVGRMPHL